MPEEFRNYILEVRRGLKEFSGRKNWKAFFGFVGRTIKKLELTYEFTVLKTVSEESGKSGIILVSPEGQEIYRETPKTRGWEYRVVREALRYGGRH